MEFKPSDTCIGPLAPGASCLVSITFTPDATGKRTGHLIVTSNGTDPSVAVTLTGVGKQGAIKFSPKSVNFGKSPAGLLPVTKTLTIVNNNPVPMSIGAITSSNPVFVPVGCANSSIGPKSTCPVTLTFRPLSVGKQKGTLTINDDAARNPQSVGLVGVGR